MIERTCCECNKEFLTFARKDGTLCPQCKSTRRAKRLDNFKMNYAVELRIDQLKRMKMEELRRLILDTNCPGWRTRGRL